VTTLESRAEIIATVYIYGSNNRGLWQSPTGGANEGLGPRALILDEIAIYGCDSKKFIVIKLTSLLTKFETSVDV